MVNGTTYNRTKNATISVILLVFLICGCWTSALSQVGGGDASGLSSHGSTTNFRFAEPNELTIIVGVLGAVHQPGRYEVSRTIDLMNLLALAGGTSPDADVNNIRVRRFYTTGEKPEWREIIVDLDRPNDPIHGNIDLQHGDFVMVGTKSSITMQEILSYVTTAAVLTTAYITIKNR